LFDEFDTIKQIKSLEKYGVWYCVWKMTVFQKKYGTVLFGMNSLKIRENHCTSIQTNVNKCDKSEIGI
jgi:hypothetical protein